MDLILKAITQAGKEQERLEAALDEAGVTRIPTTSPPFYLIAASDLEQLTAIAAQFRCKPRVLDADEDDVPEPGESTTPTSAIVALIHQVGYTFNWDDDTRLWCVSGLRDGFTDETADAPARSLRIAAFAALRHVIS